MTTNTTDEAAKRQPPPRCVIEFALNIGAEDRETLARRLEGIAFQVRTGQVSDSGCWGGVGTNGNYTFDQHPDLTPEQYREQLEAWCDAAPSGTPSAGGG